MRWEGDRPIGRLSDDTEETLDPSTVRVENDVPYIKVKGGRFDARISTSAWAVLQLGS
jgi:hypothetical protein